jgi:hypothetical protein
MKNITLIICHGGLKDLGGMGCETFSRSSSSLEAKGSSNGDDQIFHSFKLLLQLCGLQLKAPPQKNIHIAMDLLQLE